MRHQKTRHKLSRTSSHRKALLRNLCKEVIEHERIKTTEAKAKAVKPEVEQLITLAKRGDLHARRQALSACRRACRSPRLASVMSCSSSGLTALALASDVLMRSCWMTSLQRLASSALRCEALRLSLWRVFWWRIASGS